MSHVPSVQKNLYLAPVKKEKKTVFHVRSTQRFSWHRSAKSKTRAVLITQKKKMWPTRDISGVVLQRDEIRKKLHFPGALVRPNTLPAQVRQLRAHLDLPPHHLPTAQRHERYKLTTRRQGPRRLTARCNRSSTV